MTIAVRVLALLLLAPVACAMAQSMEPRDAVARRLGTYMGVDLAKGPEETAICIQAGGAWR
jgi:hypothetical protein